MYIVSRFVDVTVECDVLNVWVAGWQCNGRKGERCCSSLLTCAHCCILLLLLLLLYWELR